MRIIIAVVAILLSASGAVRSDEAPAQSSINKSAQAEKRPDPLYETLVKLASLMEKNANINRTEVSTHKGFENTTRISIQYRLMDANATIITLLTVQTFDTMTRNGKIRTVYWREEMLDLRDIPEFPIHGVRANPSPTGPGKNHDPRLTVSGDVSPSSVHIGFPHKTGTPPPKPIRVHAWQEVEVPTNSRTPGKRYETNSMSGSTGILFPRIEDAREAEGLLRQAVALAKASR